MKKLLFFLFIAIFCVSCGVTAFAATSTDKVLASYIGDTVMAIGSANGLVSEVASDVPFKDASDKALHVFGTSTFNCLTDSSGKNYLNTKMPSYIGSVKTYKKVSISFDFLLGKADTAVSFRGAQQSASITTFMKFATGKDVNINEWNRAVLVLGADGADNTFEVYLNGKLYNSGITSDGAYGFSTTGWIMCHSGLNCDFDGYIDNIIISGGNQGYVTDGKPELLPLDSGYVVKDSTLMGVSINAKVGDLLSSVGASIPDSQIKVYDSSFNILSDSDSISDDCTVVVISPEGIYSYYKIESAMQQLLLYDGSETVVRTESAGIKISKAVENAPDKTSDDLVYKMYGTAEADLTVDSHGKGYINLNLGSVIGDTKKYKKIAVMFDVYINNNGTGVFLRGKQCGGSNMTFGKVIGGVNAQNGRWNNVLYLIDAGEDASKAVLYINGEYVDAKTLASGAYGFENFGWILPYAKEGAAVEIYLDNISVYAGNGNSFGYVFPEIESTGNGYTLVGKTIFGFTNNAKVSDVLGAIVLKDNLGSVFAVDTGGKVLSDDDKTSSVAYVVAQNNGLYTYYGAVYLDAYQYGEGATSTDSSILPTIYAQTPLNKFKNNGEKLYIDFGTPFASAESIATQNIILVDENGKEYACTSAQAVHTGDSDFCRGAIVSFAGTDYGTEYKLLAKGIAYYNDSQLCSMDISGRIIIMPDPTKDSLMANMIKNDLSSDGWTKYGALSKLSMDYDETLGKYVLATVGRVKYFNGIQQNIPYIQYYNHSFDKPEDTSTYHIDYSLRLPENADKGQNMRVSLTWFINGVENVCVYDKYYNNLTPGKWLDVSEDVDLKVPSKVATAESAWLRMHIEGVNNGSVASDFSVCGVSIRKWVGAEAITLCVNEQNSIGSFDENSLGFAYEGGYWYADSYGAVVEKDTNNINPNYLEYLEHYDMKTLRIGGYGSNYDFWKADLGDIENRLPTYAPAPEWDWPSPDVEGFWRKGIVYTGNVERLQYAEAIDEDASIVMCVNMWSALPKDTDYSKKYETPIYPERAFDAKTKTIDYTVLENITQNIIDYMRFCILDPSDARAIGSDGINWAQRRVDLGHEKPYNIKVWELGNEFYLRNLSGKQYAEMCKYVIPKIKAVFPDEKLCIHVTNGYTDWLWEVISPLAKDVDYVSTHAYYDYGETEDAAQEIRNVQKAIETSSNKELKILITEGGLNTFRDYVGPSNQSIAMCTSFASFMNRIAGINNLESFQYYGGPTQISYNYGLQFRRGWEKVGMGKISDAVENGENVTSVCDRESWAAGIKQDIPLFCFIDDNSTSNSASYDLSYDLMVDTYKDSCTPIEIKLEWYGDSVSYGKVYSKVIEEYQSGQWNSINAVARTISIPNGLEKCENAVLRISIVGARTPTIADNGKVSVKNFRLVKSGSEENLVRNAKISYGEMYDDYRDTALGELMQYYINHAQGEMVQSYVASDVSSNYISSLAVKNGDTLTLIIANTDSENEYIINFDGGEYALWSKYVLRADDIYAQRNMTENAIITEREYYNSDDLFETITLPKLSVVAVELKDVKSAGGSIADKVVFGDNGVTVSGTNDKKNSAIYAVFTDDDGNVMNVNMKKSEGKYSCNFECNDRYTRVKLYNWQSDNIKPLGLPQLFKAE